MRFYNTLLNLRLTGSLLLWVKIGKAAFKQLYKELKQRKKIGLLSIKKLP